MEQVLDFCVSNFPNYGLMLFNVFSLVNTWLALGLSVFLRVDTLTFVRYNLRATESMSNAVIFNYRNIKCSVNALVQIGMFLRVGF